MRNVEINNSSSVSGSFPFAIGPYMDNARFENIKVTGGPDNTTCMQIIQPNRETTIDGLLIEDCGANGIDFVGSDMGAAAGLDEALTIRNLTIRDVPADGFNTDGRSGIQIARQVRHLTIDGFNISGVSNHPILVADNVLDSVFRNGVIDTRPARNWGVGLEADLPENIECDWRRKGYWVTSTNASNTGDCDFTVTTGGSTNTCICDGDGTWTDTSLGITRIGLKVNGSLTMNGLIFENLLFLNTFGDDAIEFGSAVTNSVFKNIHTRDQDVGASASAHGALNLFAGSSGVTVQNVTCGDGIESTEDCVVVDGWDDLTSQSVINQNGGGGDVAGLACTTGMIYTRDDGGTNTTLYICENSLWVAM